MSPQQTLSVIRDRRAELLAELFFQDMGPVFISRPTTQDIGYDLLVGFTNDKDGINTFAIVVKATETSPGSRTVIPRRIYNSLAHSNVPGLLLVIDAKHSRLYYAWLRASDRRMRGKTISVELTEIDDDARRALRKRFTASQGDAAAAG